MKVKIIQMHFLCGPRGVRPLFSKCKDPWPSDSRWEIYFIDLVGKVVTLQRFAARVGARQTLLAPGPFRIEFFLSVTPRWDLGRFPASQFVLD